MSRTFTSPTRKVSLIGSRDPYVMPRKKQGFRRRKMSVGSMVTAGASVRWRTNWAGSVHWTLVYHLILRRGVLDGGSVWSYARRQLIYQLLILEARRERRRDEKGLSR